MMSNLAKTPLMAIFYAALFYFTGVFPPFSASYQEGAAGFSMPLSGHLLLLGWALLVSVLVMFVFSMLPGDKLLSIGLFFLTTVGLLWVVPALPMLWYGDRENMVTNLDLLLNLARGVFSTLLLFVMAALLRKKDAPKQDGPVYKLHIPKLIITSLALPVLYVVLYLADWYFLGWKNDAIRLYSGGPAEAETLVKAILENLLLQDAMFLPFVLLSGLAVVLFLLPLLLRLPSKRIGFLVGTLLMSLSSGLWMLIPAPWIQPQLRLPLFVRDAALLVLYSVVCAALLHLSYKKQAAANVVQAPSVPVVKAQKAQPQVAGVSAKQAAAAVQSTMRSDTK